MIAKLLCSVRHRRTAPDPRHGRGLCPHPGSEAVLCICVIAIAIFLGARSTFAEGLSIEPERTEFCLEHTEAGSDCVGLAANACSAQPSGGTIEGMTTCVGLERHYWPERLAEMSTKFQNATWISEAKIQSTQELEGIQTSFAQMQTGWVQFRDQVCALKRKHYANDVEADLAEQMCLMGMDGDQVLWLDWVLAAGR